MELRGLEGGSSDHIQKFGHSPMDTLDVTLTVYSPVNGQGIISLTSTNSQAYGYPSSSVKFGIWNL